MRLFQILTIAMILCTSTLVFAAKPNHTDHPLLAAYTGSSIYSKDVTQYDEYTVFKGWDKETKTYNTETLEGKVTKILYKNPPERSILEIYRNYEAAIKKAGGETLYECNQKKMECMDGYVGATLRTKFNIHGVYNKSGRYLVTKFNKDDQTLYLILGVGEKNTDIHVIEMKKMETGKVSVNTEILAEGIDKEGFVIIEGIYFDTDKTTLKPESSPALQVVADLLTQRPNMNLYVVGHTDIQGNLSHNMTLSKGRANAVVNALTTQHSISSERLQGHGVGPLAPKATNISDDGRALNRRVVLVAR